MIGYVYVDETRTNSQKAKDAIIVVNKKQGIDNIRFNKTLNGLADTYNLIVNNQKLIINLSNFGSHNTQNNLNLTKFNRASLVDSNHVIRQIAEQLNIVGLKPFNSSKLN
jgi:hypothetical protein